MKQQILFILVISLNTFTGMWLGWVYGDLENPISIGFHVHLLMTYFINRDFLQYYFHTKSINKETKPKTYYSEKDKMRIMDRHIR